jgi:hypothetical protein
MIYQLRIALNDYLSISVVKIKQVSAELEYQ